MDFDRDWHTFSLDAEVDAYGTSRIAGAHNRLREENARLRANTCDTKAFRDEEDRADRMTRELAEARVLAEARAESLEACMESDAKHRAEVARLEGLIAGLPTLPIYERQLPDLWAEARRIRGEKP